MAPIGGRQAEEFAANYLINLGYKILDQNWRTRFCEIDIVAQRDDAVHFVEVKHRSSSVAGNAAEYVTGQKLKQMHFAAEHWVHENQWDGDYQLDVIAITGGLHFTNIDFIQNVSS